MMKNPQTFYKCGHEIKLVIINTNAITLSKYLHYKSEIKDNEMCIECWIKQEKP